MQYIEGNNRNQTYFSTLEDEVSTENPVRLIDALKKLIFYLFFYTVRVGGSFICRGLELQ